ncbi:MAG: nitroreductase family protein [Ruminococcus sp.]|nr:nitroreductase family protein [Ruminococcus sp.]
MNIREAIRARHSVRQYKKEPISAQDREKLTELISEVNGDSGLNIQIIFDEPKCLDSVLARFSKFRNAENYIAIVGDKSLADLNERAGYFGEKIVIAAQMMGLNTCWIGGSFSRKNCGAAIGDDEKLVCIIAIGYGLNEGARHKSKPFAKLCDIPEAEMPVWFKAGMIAAMMAPTALNQQKFFVEMQGEEALITTNGGGMAQIDLGIVKYNFEAASGHRCV